MFGIDDAIAIGLKVLDKVIPDPTAKAQAQLELIKLQQAGEFKDLDIQLALAQSQTDINKVEAASSDRFVAGWRPFIGWVCGTAFATNFVVGPLVEWIANLYGHAVKFPAMDSATMLPVLLGMLGIGALRTTEKIKGVA